MGIFGKDEQEEIQRTIERDAKAEEIKRRAETRKLGDDVDVERRLLFERAKKRVEEKIAERNRRTPTYSTNLSEARRREDMILNQYLAARRALLADVLDEEGNFDITEKTAREYILKFAKAVVILERDELNKDIRQQIGDMLTYVKRFAVLIEAGRNPREETYLVERMLSRRLKQSEEEMQKVEGRVVSTQKESCKEWIREESAIWHQINLAYNTNTNIANEQEDTGTKEAA